ncbi:MAG: right-handed parallel beta-helix repeat-containing protein [Planctomycetota bacterium]
MHTPTTRAMLFPATLVLAALAGAAHADVIYVNADSNGGDGSEWQQAFPTLDAALAIASQGDEIWVAAGEYAPNPSDGRNATFTIPDGVRVFGGFRGEEEQLEERSEDPFENASILTGRVTDTYSVVTMSNTGPSTELNGFVIEGGRADNGVGGSFRERGGGIFGANASPTLRLLIVQDNAASDTGGGLYITADDTDPLEIVPVVIDQCEFINNSAEDGGGAAIVDSATITDSRFRGNDATGLGGGLYLRGDGSFVVEDCRIDNNTAIRTGPDASLFGFGGGIATFMLDNGDVSIVDCRINDNTAGSRGGGVYFGNSGRQTIRQSRVFGNVITMGNSFGGGISIDIDDADGSSLIESTAIIGNESNSGAGIGIDGDHPSVIANTTIAGNMSMSIVGGIQLRSTDAAIDNTIIYGNESLAPNGTRSASISLSFGATATVNNSIVEFWFGPGGPLPGFDVVDTDPIFVDADGADDVFGTSDDNIRLMPGSPAIDAGNGTLAIALSPVDVYGAPREADDPDTPNASLFSAVDIGAAEFQPEPPADCPADTNGDGELNPADFNAWVINFNAGC